MWCVACTCCIPLCVFVLQTRSPSSSGDSGDGADDDCSPKSHSTQLINIPEMAAQVAAEQQRDKAMADAAAAAAASVFEQHQFQHAATDAAFDITTSQQQLPRGADSVEIMAAGGHQQQQLQEAQQPLPGLSARPLGSDEYSGSGEAVYTSDEALPGDEDPDRDLSVACQQAEENKLSFQLKFTEPEGELWGGTCWAWRLAD